MHLATPCMGSPLDQFPLCGNVVWLARVNSMQCSGEVIDTRHTNTCLLQDNEIRHAIVVERPGRRDPRYAGSQDHDLGVHILA